MSALTPELASAVAQAAEAGETVEVEGVLLRAGDLLIETQSGPDLEAEAGTASASDEVCAVTLDTTIDKALSREGLAREVIHRVQNLRRDSGLDPADRIELGLETVDGELSAALADFAGMIASETLAVSMADGRAVDGAGHEGSVEIEGAALAVSLRRVRDAG